MSATLSKENHGSDLPPADLIEALLRELVAEVRGLRADVKEFRQISRNTLPHKAALSRADRVLLALTASVEDKAFSAREVMERATLLDVDLRAALDAAGLVNARKLGKWLRTIEGRVIAGLRLERIGLDRDGIIWRVWRVSNSHTHPAHCDDDERGA